MPERLDEDDLGVGAADRLGGGADGRFEMLGRLGAGADWGVEEIEGREGAGRDCV